MILMRVKNWLQRITARINNWVPIKIYGTSFIVRNTNISIVIKQSQFLLRLSWAFAIHKVQSLSLQEPVLSFDLQRQKIFKPGQMYLVHLQLFSIKHKIVLLQVVWCQIFVFPKSCLSQTEENSCFWTYGRTSLVSDFKFIREKDDLIFSRHK